MENNDDIKPDPDQPRKTFDAEAMERLTQSIKDNGIEQPIIVRQNGDEVNRVAKILQLLKDDEPATVDNCPLHSHCTDRDCLVLYNEEVR